MSEQQQEELSEVVGSNAETVEAAADGSQLAAPASQQDEPKAQARPNSGSSVATKIAAFASGVAYVKGGIKDASEDAILVEDVLHKFEAASRRPGDGELQLPLPLIRAAYEHLLSARQEASRAAKELAELKASRVQHIPPSTWVKREAKYKMDQEKYEHTISMLNQRIERLESELHVLQEGANLRPLEEKIKDLESQLVAASEEKTKVQSKYHELSIKHRQLIETSPQVATIWNEVLVQQAQAHGDAAAEQRLRNFDLRHTGASSGLSITGNQVRSPAAVTASGEVSPRKLMGVSAATAIFSGNGIPQVPVSAAGIRADGKTVTAATQHLLEAASIDAGPQTPVLFDSTASPSSSAPSSRAVSAAGPAAADGAAAGSVGAAAVLAAVPGLQTAEERAQALMQAVALEGLSPEASLAALQQLNYDLTMQLALYQQMVGRLKDAMEQSDLEKAELEAEKVAIEQQLAAALNGHMDGLATAHSMGAASGNSKRGWGLGGFWRRGGANATTEEGEVEGSFADTNSITGLASLSSSRTASMDLEAVVAGHSSGSPRSAADTPTLRDSTSSSQSAAESAESQQQQQPGGEAGSAGAGGPTTSATAAAATRSTSIGRVFAQRRASAAARAATAAENMQKELKEVRRQLTSVQDENKFLVQNLVEIKMELAETQSSHDQAKRALVRAMDREVCLDTKVSELAYMLDMLTSQQDRGSVPVTGPTTEVKSTSNASATAVVAAEQADEQQQSIQLDGDDAEMQQQDAADASVAATEPIEHKAESLVADRTNGVQDAHKAPAEIEGDADMLDNSAAGSSPANVEQRAPAVDAAVDSSVVEAHSISNAGSNCEDVDSKSSSKSEFLQQEQQDLKAAG